MPEFLEVSMYMDEANVEKHLTDIDFAGIDNTSFPGYVVPFAPSIPGEKIALKKFARAHKANKVKKPTHLLKIKIPAKDAVQHFLDKDIKVMEDRPEKTVAFAKRVNMQNYPSMSVELIEMDVQGGPEDLLKAGLELLRGA